MKILLTVEFYEPSKGGAQEVVKQIAERLAAKGHDVTVATSALPNRTERVLNGVNISDFHIAGSQVKGYRGDTALYQEFLLKSNFDVIFNYAAQVWTTDILFPLLEKLKAKKVIAPLGYSRLHHPRYRQYFESLPSILSNYDKIVYTSPEYQDKEFGDRHGLGSKAVIIPNGASKEEFSASLIDFKKNYGIATPYLFLCVSNHYFDKGHLFVLEAFRKLKGRDCTLVIIGERPSRHSWYSCSPICSLISATTSQIRILSSIPRSDVVAAYQQADLFLFGSKVECAPLVMYESFATRTAFITTDVGNVKDHRSVIRLVSSPEAMLQELRHFITDPDSYRKLAAHAFQFYEVNHTWEYLSGRYESLFTDVCKR
ncbi:MAG: glycosyltransferase family 4 protein [bacterium]